MCKNRCPRNLKGLDNVYLIEPRDYLPFVYLMKQSYLILTDSGGIQEERPPWASQCSACAIPQSARPPSKLAPYAWSAPVTRPWSPETVRLLDDELAYQVMSHANNPMGMADQPAYRREAVLGLSGDLGQQIDSSLQVA